MHKPLTAEAEMAGRILKVNHAGENGAVHIYAGQLFFARFTAPAMVAELLEFKSHEEKHRALFWAELQRRGRPRCRSYGLCAVWAAIVSASSPGCSVGVPLRPRPWQWSGWCCGICKPNWQLCAVKMTRRWRRFPR
jgi:Ubiquinone biosynthesis protein COQ7